MTEPVLTKPTGASMNRHASSQIFATPQEFMSAVRMRFGAPDWDLAASIENAQAPKWFDAEADALRQDWCEFNPGGLSWLNPPFGNCASWASKCSAEMQRGARILFLTPASVGANWFQQYVVPFAHVIELSPRMSFDGKNPFPKDLVLSVYMHGLTGRSHWRWK